MTESNRRDLQQQLFEPAMFEMTLADGTEAGRGQAPRFLIVDDEPEGRALVAGVILSRWPGAVIRIASGNAEAFQVLLGVFPDIVITELSRAGGAGYEFLRKLRLSPQLAATPVVLSSRRDGEGDAFGISVEGLQSVVTGNADIYLVPEIETGYQLVQALVFFGKLETAGIILGTVKPVMPDLPFLSDEDRFAELALAAFVSHKGAIHG